MSDFPKVTCFMPTRNRRAWLPSAIRNWQLQTYANRELLIVADGEKVNDLIPQDDSRITLVHLTDPERPNLLPEKFNIACNIAKGEILAKWDDDDWYAPSRLSDQVHLMKVRGAAVAGYRNILFTDGKDFYRYIGWPDWVSGTTLMFRRDWWERHPFKPESPGENVGSDNGFCRRALELHQLTSIDAGNTVVASIHPWNTSNKQLHQGAMWHRLKDFPGVPGYSWPLDAKAAA